MRLDLRHLQLSRRRALLFSALVALFQPTIAFGGAEGLETDTISIKDSATLMLEAVPDSGAGAAILTLRVRPEIVDPGAPVILQVFLKTNVPDAEKYIGSYGFFPPPAVGEEREIVMPMPLEAGNGTRADGSAPRTIEIRLFKSDDFAPANPSRLRVIDVKLRRQNQ